MEKMPYTQKIQFNLSIGFSQACQSEVVEISGYWDKDEWELMTATEQREALDEYHNEWSKNYIDGSWSAA